MGTIADIYTKAVYENLHPLFANWEPGKSVQLGDFGIQKGKTLITLGNIFDRFGIKPAAIGGVQVTKSGDHRSFASRGSTDVKFNAAGSGPTGVTLKASLEITFSSSDAVFLIAANCHYHSFKDKVAVGERIMKLYQGDLPKWKREWVVVTDVVESQTTTIAVSGGDSASIVFEASENVPMLDLADAKIGLNVRSARNVGYQLASRTPLFPLIGLCQIQPTFLIWGHEFQPKTMSAPRSKKELGHPTRSPGLNLNAPLSHPVEDEESDDFKRMMSFAQLR